MTGEGREARVRCGKHWLTSHKFVHQAHPHSSITKRPKALKAHRVCTASHAPQIPQHRSPQAPQLRSSAGSTADTTAGTTARPTALRGGTPHTGARREHHRESTVPTVCVDAYLGERDAGGRYPPHELPRRQGVERHLLQVVVHGYSRTPRELASAPRPARFKGYAEMGFGCATGLRIKDS